MLHTPLPPETGVSGTGNAAAASGLCWIGAPEGEGLSWSHAGALVATCVAWLIRRADGTTISGLFNAQPTEAGEVFGDLIRALTQTADGIRSWPSFDLFQAE